MDPTDDAGIGKQRREHPPGRRIPLTPAGMQTHEQVNTAEVAPLQPQSTAIEGGHP